MYLHSLKYIFLTNENFCYFIFEHKKNSTLQKSQMKDNTSQKIEATEEGGEALFTYSLRDNPRITFKNKFTYKKFEIQTCLP